MKVNPPEEVWDNIKDEPILIQTKPATGKSKVIRYSLATAAASVFVMVASFLAVNNNFFNQPQLTGELNATNSTSNTLQNSDKGTERNETTGEPNGTTETEGRGDAAQSETTQPPQTSQGTQGQAPSTNGSQGEQNMGINIPYYKVWEHTLYILAPDDAMYVQETDIDKQLKQTVNGVEFTIYSIKGVPVTEAFAYNANGIYHRYIAAFNGEFEFNGGKYGIVDAQAYYYPEPEKGQYLGEVDGKKIYEFVGNDKAVLVDLSRSINVGGAADELLYVAELLN